jgi:hypothetical protein
MSTAQCLAAPRAALTIVPNQLAIAAPLVGCSGLIQHSELER